MPGFQEFWVNLIPANVFAFQASGIFGKFDPCRCFRIRGFENAARLKFPQNIESLKCENTGRDQSSPKIPEILASMGSAGAIVAQIWGILGQEFCGNLVPVDVFASEVAKMLPGSNFPKISKT